jgi:hypothetical protein
LLGHLPALLRGDLGAVLKQRLPRLLSPGANRRPVVGRWRRLTGGGSLDHFPLRKVRRS